jgi:hypothetical protein
VQRISISAQFHGQAAQPAGEPPTTDPVARSVAVTAVTEAGSDAGIDRISYANHVVFSSESTFTERGVMTFGDGDADAVDLDTVGEGTLGPSPEDGLLQGAVVWRVTGGRGRFAGASGLVASNFLLSAATGEVDEWEAAVLFVP